MLDDMIEAAIQDAVPLGQRFLVCLPNGVWVRPDAVTQISLRRPKRREEWQSGPPTMVQVSISGDFTFISVPPGKGDQEFADEIARLINGE